MKVYRFLAVIGVLFGTIVVSDAQDVTENGARQFLIEANEKFREQANLYMVASWNYQTDATDENDKIKTEVDAKATDVKKNLYERSKQYSWDSYEDEELKRQHKLLFSSYSTPDLAADKSQRYDEIVTEMTNTAYSATICDFKDKSKCDINMDSGFYYTFSGIKNAEELKYYYVEYFEQVAKGIKPLYEEYVKLSNEAAVLNGYPNRAADWISEYSEDYKGFIEMLKSLWKELTPFYQQIHAYYRTKLRAFYGDELIPKCGPLPAYLVGDLLGLGWSSNIDITRPYPDVKSANVNDNFNPQNLKVMDLAKEAEKFYTSTGLLPMTDVFWKESIFERPDDKREMICQASSWDMYNHPDYRIFMCGDASFDSFARMHHLMGYVEQYMAYKDLPYCYRQSSNSALDTALGFTIALSVQTPAHLKKVGLLSGELDTSREADLNYLFQAASDRIVFLPYALTVELWRYSVFDGTIKSDQYNSAWWDLRLQYEGYVRPEESTKDDFDLAGIYQVVADYTYIQFFLANLIQFQIQEALCTKIGQYDPNDPSKPLHLCDIYGNAEAGELLKSMLELGSSKPWQDVLEAVSGTRDINPKSFLNYCQPIIKWLEEENKKNNECIGWDEA